MKWLRGLALVLVLLAAWIVGEVLMFKRNVPPPTVTDVQRYLAWRPETPHLYLLGGANGSHVMATGPGSGLVPSGPSAYIFDRSGRLVDWCEDVGDDPVFDQKWSAQASRGAHHAILPSEVEEWMTSATRPATQPDS